MKRTISSVIGLAAGTLVASVAMGQEAGAQVGLTAQGGTEAPATATADAAAEPPAVAEPAPAAAEPAPAPAPVAAEAAPPAEAVKAEGLEIRASEDVFLKFSGFAQFRYNFVERSTHLEGGESVDYHKGMYHGMSIPRARLYFDGGLAKWLGFRARLGLKEVGYVSGVDADGNPVTSTAPVAVFEQVYADFKAKGEGASYKLRVGVHKPHLYENDSMSGERVELVDSSTAAAFFSQGDINNFEGSMEMDMFRVFLSLHNGVKEAYGNAYAGIEGDTDVAEIGAIPRFEVQLMDTDWKRWDHQSSWKGNKTAVKIGLAGNYQMGKDNVQLETSRWDATLDVRAAGDGWNAMLAGMTYSTAVDPIGDQPGQEKQEQMFYGFQVQGGYFVTEPLEIAARFANTTLASQKEDGQAGQNAAGEDLKASGFNELAAGVNYYLFPKKYTRLQADFVYYLQGTQSDDADKYASPITKADPNRGLLVGDAATWAVRTQFTAAW